MPTAARSAHRSSRQFRFTCCTTSARIAKAAVQGHYGATDMNPKPDDVRAFYAKLKQTNPNAEFYIYEGAGHAFHDFSRPAYNAEVATKAWGRTLEFFRKHLS